MSKPVEESKLVAISGTTGLVGGYARKYFKDKGYEVLEITRDKFQLSDQDFAVFLEGCSYIINLAGENVSQKWTDEHKEKILNSRLETTRKFARAIPLMKTIPERVINASAIGIYDYNEVHNESSTAYGDTFLTDVVKQWEAAADEIKATGVMLFKCRIGVVMSERGGILEEYLRFIKRGIALQFGNGEQPVSFIHIHDLVRAFNFLLNDAEEDGVYNLVAPEGTTNHKLALQLKRVFKKVIVVAIPPFLMKIVKGEMSTLAIHGEHVVPQRLEKAGFDFTFPNIENVLFYLFV